MAGVGLLGEGPRYGCSRGRRLQSSTEADRGEQRHEAEWEPRKGLEGEWAAPTRSVEGQVGRGPKGRPWMHMDGMGVTPCLQAPHREGASGDGAVTRWPVIRARPKGPGGVRTDTQVSWEP